MWRVLGKIFLLGCARKVAKQTTAAIETLSVALVLWDAHHHRRERDSSTDLLTEGSEASPSGQSSTDNAQDLVTLLLPAAHSLFLPAVCIKAVRLLRRILCGTNKAPPVLQPAALATSTEEIDRKAQLVPLAPPKLRPQLPQLPKQLPRQDWGTVSAQRVAAHYSAWVELLQRVLALQGLRELPPDLDPDGLELPRYLVNAGLLKAANPKDAARCVSGASAAVHATLTWRKTYPLMGPAQLLEEAWDDVVWWQGPDEEGCLWLVMHLQRALERCAVGGPGAERLCERAVLSQVDVGTRLLMLRPSPLGTLPADRVKVLVLGTGCNVRQLLRFVQALRHFTTTVHRYFPARLRAMLLVNLPRPLRLALGALLSLLPLETRKKIKMCPMVDLPDSITSGLAVQEEIHLSRLRATWNVQPASSPSSPSTPTRLSTATAIVSGGITGLAAAAGMGSGMISAAAGGGASCSLVGPFSSPFTAPIGGSLISHPLQGAYVVGNGLYRGGSASSIGGSSTAMAAGFGRRARRRAARACTRLMLLVGALALLVAAAAGAAQREPWEMLSAVVAAVRLALAGGGAPVGVRPPL